MNQIGTVKGNTFDKNRVTGLTNCANSAQNLVEISAKSKCG